MNESELHKGRLLIDHDHRLGGGNDHIRGLICQKCNAAMKYGLDLTCVDSPHYRRRCLAGRVDKWHLNQIQCPPPQEKRGREAVPLWETAA